MTNEIEMETQIAKYKDMTGDELLLQLQYSDNRIAELEKCKDELERIINSPVESEQRYKVLIEASTDMIFTVNMNGDFSFVNKAFETHLGYSEDEIKRINGFGLVHPEDKRYARESFYRLTKGENIEIEYRYQKKDGSYIDISNYATPIFDSEGVVTSAIGIARNITKQKKEENEALQKSEEKLRLMFESITEGVTVTDLNGTILQVNEATVRLHGYDNKDDLIGRNTFEFIAKKDHRKAEGNLKKTLIDGHLDRTEYTLRRKDGSEFTGELTAAVLKDIEGNVAGFITITKDVTELKKAQEQAQRTQLLDALGGDDFSLVILDIIMPGKSGVELLPEIRTHYPDIALIMATSVLNVSTAIECMKHGAYDYVTKPFKLDEVALSTRRALEKRNLEIENKEYRQYLKEKVEEQARRIRASFLGAITSLAYALEAKDYYTSGHSQRVAGLSVTLARALKLPQASIERIRTASLVHDLGKIGIREAVLNKPDHLTDEEYQEIQSHPEKGENILRPVAEDEELLQIVRNHHERYDGTGYPDLLKGERIPLGARILSIADAYEAMTSDRPYRNAMKGDIALMEIKRNKGTQFDPDIVDVFIRSRGSR